MAKRIAPYRSYVIRCWGEPSSQAGTNVYRFTLDVPATGQRFGFTHSEDLIDALEFALDQMQTQAIADVISKDDPD